MIKLKELENKVRVQTLASCAFLFFFWVVGGKWEISVSHLRYGAFIFVDRIIWEKHKMCRINKNKKKYQNSICLWFQPATTFIIYYSKQKIIYV